MRLPEVRDEQERLLDYAEALLGAAVRHKPLPPAPDLAVLGRPAGVFATLKIGAALRGCIGTFAGDRPLGKILPGVVRDAALADHRFAPVASEELPEITIALSILSPTRPVRDRGEVELGRHGVVLEVAGRRAVFLPEVAIEQRWDIDTTLRMLEHKAGLPRGSADRADAVIEVFESVKIDRAGGERP